MSDTLKNKRFHFAGIGGVGMAGLAFLLKKSGCDVSGCDIHPSARTRWLEANGIPVASGHSPDHVRAGTGTCVFTPAVARDNPEFAAAAGLAREGSLCVKWRGELLAEIFNSSCGIAVCGTHGKTTTATFTAKLLRALGDDPSWCIGGETGDFPVAGAGTGPLVAEADESDGTLALYRAKILVVTSLDFDHPEHFKSEEEYLACYNAAISAAEDTIDVSRLPADDWPEIAPLVSGAHNVRNARAAVEVALRRGHSREKIAAALPEALSALPDRRFERVWPDSGAPAVVTDYAHHPAEIECAVSMARALNPKRLRVIFQPHRHSRTKSLKKEFPSAFAGADEVVLAPVYSAFEKPVPGGDIADLYLEFRNAPPSLRLLLARSLGEAWRHVFLTYEPGDTILLLGAGDIISLVPQAKKDMAAIGRRDARSVRMPVSLAPFSFFRTGGVTYGKVVESAMSQTTGENATIVAGMGSNIWFSDCATDADIIKAPSGCNAAKPGATLLEDHPELAFMAGIPGTVGGWVKMNAGAFGDCIGNHVEYVTADGRKIPAAQCGFGYRESSIRGIITDVAFKASGKDRAAEGKESYLARRKKFPPRTCGSVFKNPAPETPAGRLLEEAGAKTMRVGGAHVWEEHANVIVAGDGCTSSDILALARLMAAAVKERHGITLEPEISGLDVSGV